MDEQSKQAPKAPRGGRSPAGPSIGLQEAMARLQQLYEIAKNHEVLIEGIASEAWKSNHQTAKRIAGSLEHFGLVERTNEKKKIKISTRGMIVLLDERPPAKERALAAAATQHPLLSECVRKWGHSRPQDKICLTELRLEKSFTETGAEEFLKVFDQTIGYAIDPLLAADSNFQPQSYPNHTHSCDGISIEVPSQSTSYDAESTCNDPAFSSCKNPLGLMQQISVLLKQLSSEDRSTAIRWIQSGHL